MRRALAMVSDGLVLGFGVAYAAGWLVAVLTRRVWRSVPAFVRAIPDVVSLALDRRRRVNHGLEHATIAVLLGRGHDVVGGRSCSTGFEVTVRRVPSLPLTTMDHAIVEAVRRVATSEPDLAYHPMCGTRAFVTSVVVASAAVASVVAVVLGVPAIAALAALAIAFAPRLALRLSVPAQRLLTVSTRYSTVHLSNLRRAPKGVDADVFTVDLRVDDPGDACVSAGSRA